MAPSISLPLIFLAVFALQVKGQSVCKRMNFYGATFEDVNNSPGDIFYHSTNAVVLWGKGHTIDQPGYLMSWTYYSTKLNPIFLDVWKEVGDLTYSLVHKTNCNNAARVIGNNTVFVPNGLKVGTGH